ncbi:MAG: hypothetical protein WBF77_06485, partial [Sulfurimonadaceae bacterium]
MKYMLIVAAVVVGLNTSASASGYGDCFQNCQSNGLSGKHWDPKTEAGACSKGCRFRHDQANDEQTNHDRAIEQCADKYGRSD